MLTLGVSASSTALAATYDSGAGAPLPGPSIAPLQALSASGGSPFDKEVAVFTSKGMSHARAAQALAAQSRVSQTDIVRRAQAATADAYGGVWFEPETAQLHVGVTSPAGRQAAEEAIAREGLTADAVVTPVRSTMAELLATQGRWNRKLATMSAGAGTSTAIQPQRNAVVVNLDSSVSAANRAALEREASAADVNVLVSVSAGRLDVRPLAKTECKTWKTFAAYCSPSITSGVTIQDAECIEEPVEIVGGFTSKEKCENRTVSGTKGKWRRITGTCSAGPLAIKNKKERVMLTAGHCIGKEKEGWWTRNKAGVEESKIGVVGAFTAGGPNEKEAAGDYAEVSIEPAWQTGNPEHPVFAVTALWKKMNEKKEERSYPVKNEKTPVVNMISCHVGQTSGESCGSISAVNRTAKYTVNGELRFFKGFVEVIEVKLETLENKGGDSGGPELTVEEPGLEARMEGMDVAGAAECVELKEARKGLRFFSTKAKCEKEEEPGEGKWEQRTINLLFQPLKRVEEGPEGVLEKLKLELLTTANE